MKRVNFEIEQADIIEDDTDSQFSTAKILAFSSGKNSHDMICSESTLRETAPSIFNKPILYSVDEILNDFWSHNDPDKSLIAGFVVPDSAEFVTLADGRIGFSILAKIWKRYAPKVIEFFKRDVENRKKVSVEMELYSSRERSDGLIEMLKFAYSGICLLGDYIREASPGANAQILSFTQEREKYQEAYEKEFSDKELITFPYKSITDANAALRGIDPPITVEQANQIAKQAESIGVDEKKNGWAIAISSFKKSHKVEDGKWVKKDKEKSSMSVKTDEETVVIEEAEKVEEKELEMAAEEEEKPEELEMADKKEEEEDEPKEEMADETEEEDKPEEKKMSLDANLDVKAMLGFLIAETEAYRKISEEVEKVPEDLDYALIFDTMLAHMGEMTSVIAEMKEFSAKQETEIEELKKYKSDIEKQQFEYQVDVTLKEVEGVIPADKLDELRVESEKYSFDDLDGWKNAVKAIAFTLKSNSEDKKDKTVRYAVPWSSKGKRINSPWKANR